MARLLLSRIARFSLNDGLSEVLHKRHKIEAPADAHEAALRLARSRSSCRARLGYRRVLSDVVSVLSARCIAIPLGIRIWLVAGVTEMRKDFDGLSTVDTQLERDPFGCQLFVFCGWRRVRVKVLCWDDDVLCLYPKTLVAGSFRMVEGAGRLRVAERGAVVDVAQRDRLAAFGGGGMGAWASFGTR